VANQRLQNMTKEHFSVKIRLLPFNNSFALPLFTQLLSEHSSYSNWSSMRVYRK